MQKMAKGQTPVYCDTQCYIFITQPKSMMYKPIGLLKITGLWDSAIKS